MRTRLLILLILFGIVQGCTPAPALTQTAAEPTQTAPTLSPPSQFPSMSPVEWILTQPFLEARYVAAEMVLSGLPEGFIALVPEYQVTQLPSGLEVQITTIEYQHPVAGQVYVEDSVSVEVFSYQSEDARTEHFDPITREGYTWDFQEVSNYLVARYSNEAVDGYIWVSGPYLIVVYSSLDISEEAPWVEPFADLYVELYPPD